MTMKSNYLRDLEDIGANPTMFAETVLGYKWQITGANPVEIYADLSDLIYNEHLGDSVLALFKEFPDHEEFVIKGLNAIACRFWGNENAVYNDPDTWGDFTLQEMEYYAQTVAMSAEWHINRVVFFFPCKFDRERNSLWWGNVISFETIPGLFASLEDETLNLDKPFYILGTPKLFDYVAQGVENPSDGSFRILWWSQAHEDIYHAFLDAVETTDEDIKIRLWANSITSIWNKEQTIAFYEKALEQTE